MIKKFAGRVYLNLPGTRETANNSINNFCFRYENSVVYWPSTWPDMLFQRRGSCIFHCHRRAWLMKWDKVKTHDTLIDWCTGREWPVNCMTVISTWWQSNMPFQRQQKWHISDSQSWGDIEWAIELLYNSVKTGSHWVWRPDLLVTRWGRESHHPAERGPWDPRVSLETRWWQDVVEKASTLQKAEPLGLRLSNPGYTTIVYYNNY